MAQRVFHFDCEIPTGSTPTNPVTIPTNIDGYDIESIDLEVPAGPSGLMGFYIENNGVQWIPHTPGTWIVWDNVQNSWQMEGQPNGQGWGVVGYNLGAYPHVVTVRYHVNPAAATATAQAPTINIVTTPADQADPVILS